VMRGDTFMRVLLTCYQSWRSPSRYSVLTRLAFASTNTPVDTAEAVARVRCCLGEDATERGRFAPDGSKGALKAVAVAHGRWALQSPGALIILGASLDFGTTAIGLDRTRWNGRKRFVW
jgi:hypothetical protein